MRILLVHNSYQQYGGEDGVVRQEKEVLARAGHDVSVYEESNEEIRGYSAIQRMALPVNTLWSTSSRNKIVELIEKHRPQIVHVHNTFVVISPSIYSACHERGIPVVQTLHNYRLLCPAATLLRDGRICEECIDHSLWRSVRYGCYHGRRLDTATAALMLAIHRSRGTWTNEVSSYIALSEFSRNKFIEAGFSRDKVFVKPNFVDPDPHPSASPAKDRGYALFVGRVCREKGTSTLIAAWNLLKSSIPLVIIGAGPERASLEAQAAGLSNVRFCGFQSRAQTLDAMRGAAFLIFPSTWYEPFGMTIVEAFACSTPVICSRLGAIPDIVEDGRTGFHFTPGDAHDLAEKVSLAWARPERLRSMGNEARIEYENTYTAEKNYPILMRIYEHALANGSVTASQN